MEHPEQADAEKNVLFGVFVIKNAHRWATNQIFSQAASLFKSEHIPRTQCNTTWLSKELGSLVQKILRDCDVVPYRPCLCV
jgi:hypothetical protein